MRLKIGLAAIVVALTFNGIAFLLIPGLYSSLISTSACVAFTIALIYFITVLLTLKTSSSGDDAAAIASVGPLLILSVSVLALAGIAFLSSIFLFEIVTIIFVILSISTAVVGHLVWSSASDIITKAASRTAKRSLPTEWRLELESVDKGHLDDIHKRQIAKLADQMRYAASSLSDFSFRDEAVTNAVSSLVRTVGSGDFASLEGRFLDIEKALELRERDLRAARSKS